jgi:hypothetical protein
MKLEVHPDETLVDQPLRTVVCKRERVSLPCAGTSALSWRLALAGATFIADGNGRIDLNTGAPIYETMRVSTRWDSTGRWSLHRCQGTNDER